MTTPAREQVLPVVQEVVADSLALDPEECLLDKRLIDDLGADSLDFIDMIFLLEKKFSVKIREGELDFLSRLDASSAQGMQGGPLSPEEVEQLTPWLPALKDVPDKTTVTPGQLFGLITVETLCVLVESKLTAGN